MNKEQAKEIIIKTFENCFDKGNFIQFIANLLKSYNREKALPPRYGIQGVTERYLKFIKAWQRIGVYENDSKRIDILIVELQKDVSLYRARSTQRNFVADYLQGKLGTTSEKNAALVAFVSPDSEDWRFSLVKMDYRLETPSGKGKVKEEFTPARRWSFLVGKNEKSHTAQSRFLPILENDEWKPTLEDLEQAFNVEVVTKEFFDKYRSLLIRTVGVLDNIVAKDPIIKNDFASKNINTVDFAKKLSGQIVFLCFLQKKGWFGVARDADWGTGPKDFLRKLFNKEYADYENFFNDILEPLFYEALARKRDDDYYSRFNCKIPFLNGGLFEPIGGYDWVHIDIKLPDELFSNKEKTPEGDIGDGILDVFDRFNFTVKEDEPLEKEVAIDPELLGKLYEKFNAIRPDNFYEYKKALVSGKENLEKQFNKKFGVYYTPREIVHYMCRESLSNYLKTELNEKVNSEDLQKFFNYAETQREFEKIAIEREEKIKSGTQKTTRYESQIPEIIRNNAKQIDNLLAEIKVCDPAVGSGAFPIGIMHEIVKLRQLLSVYIGDQVNAYDLKRHCIENSLYGVDIDPGAVEICKLRFWLSMIVDEEDIRKIKPLPNLDYKIMQGNSLISEFLEINFDVDEGKQSGLIENEINQLIKQFQKKKIDFLNEADKSKKEQLKQEIDDLITKIFEEKLKEKKSDYFSKLKSIEERGSFFTNEEQRKRYIREEKENLYKKTGFNLEQIENQLKEYTSGGKQRHFFLWKLYFAEVFQEKGGFDIVIANPPYGNLLKSHEKKSIKDKYSFSTLSDISSPFIERGFNLLKNQGNLIFIITYAITFSKDFSKSRELIANGFGENYIYTFDRDKCRIFESMTQTVSIIKCFNKNAPDKKGIFSSRMFRETPDIYKIEVTNCNKYLMPKKSTYNQKHRLPKIGEEINRQILDKLLLFNDNIGSIVKNSGSEIWIRTSGNYWYNAFDRKPYNGVEISPLYVDKDFSNFFISLINSSLFYFWFRIYGDGRHMNIDILENFPLPHKEKILRYNNLLNRMKERFMNKLFSVFEKERNRFITSNIKSEIDLLDLILGKYFYNLSYSELVHILNYDSEIRGGNKLEKPFIDLVDKILVITKDDDYLQDSAKQAKVKEYERQINQLVYKLYDLTEEEIKIVEG